MILSYIILLSNLQKVDFALTNFRRSPASSGRTGFDIDTGLIDGRKACGKLLAPGTCHGGPGAQGRHVSCCVQMGGIKPTSLNIGPAAMLATKTEQETIQQPSLQNAIKRECGLGQRGRVLWGCSFARRGRIIFRRKRGPYPWWPSSDYVLLHMFLLSTSAHGWFLGHAIFRPTGFPCFKTLR